MDFSIGFFIITSEIIIVILILIFVYFKRNYIKNCMNTNKNPSSNKVKIDKEENNDIVEVNDDKLEEESTKEKKKPKKSVKIMEDPNKKSKPINPSFKKKSKKRNSTSTMYIKGTVSKPNILELLQCVSTDITKKIQLFEEDGEESGLNKQKKMLMLKRINIYDERDHPLQENPDIDLTIIPDPTDVFLFIGIAFKQEDIASESIIMMQVYINRLINDKKLVLYPFNWRRVVLSMLILASKVWEEDEVWNSDFKSVFPSITSKDLNQLEKVTLNLLGYNLGVKSSEFIQCYFKLRSSSTTKMPVNIFLFIFVHNIQKKISKLVNIFNTYIN
eukprot:TRINITY_DN1136_c0_g1_i1.p1 TRINITY_DN1136_c0_g1~~TRINITY_DN1136_c0_g1_i1.p1  ORF type:complete len:331 (-),score=73.47 TRINITY_DN1136_c0_g1_i1:331-1323(-)